MLHMMKKTVAMAALLALTLSMAFMILADGDAQARVREPEMPPLSEPADEIRARLMEEGAWHPNATPDRSPPPDPQVGDTWDWYIWDLGGMPVANLKPCTVRGMGDNCYIIVDDEEWNVGIDQAAVDHIVANFENQSVGSFPDQGIWDLNTGHFGDPPNPLDNLDRIFLLYYRFNIAADGFFWVYDQFPDGSQPWASNEADVVYLAVDNGAPEGNYMLGVAAHEFEHMIHFNQDSNEETWLDEGLAELAMWLFGHPDFISSFNTNPDNDLVTWDGNWADYIQTYLWTLYAYEQAGGQPFIWDLIHDPANGMASYQNAFDAYLPGMTTQDFFGDWGLANFLDDPSIPDGQYGYTGDDLPAFYAWRSHNTYPAASAGSVKRWATDYVRFTDLQAAPVLTFDGQDARDFRVALMGFSDGEFVALSKVELDASQNAEFSFTEAQGCDEVVLAVANVHPYYLATYSYELREGLTAVDGQTPSGAPALAAYPNPFNPACEISFALDRPAANLRLEIFDTSGRLVGLLHDGPLPAGKHNLTWRADGLPSGVYLAALSSPGQTTRSSRLVLLK